MTKGGQRKEVPYPYPFYFTQYFTLTLGAFLFIKDTDYTEWINFEEILGIALSPLKSKSYLERESTKHVLYCINANVPDALYSTHFSN